MRVFVFGQKWLGEQVARGLVEDGHTLAGIACPADDRLRSVAAELGVRYWWDNRDAAGNPEAIPDGTDLIVSAHSFDFIRREVRACARLGAIGYHPSLLPRHKGRRSVEDTIAAGDTEAGGTVYRLSDSMDGGQIVMQRRCAVLPGEGAAGLWRRALAPMGVAMLRDVVTAFALREHVTAYAA
jgi:methionyl-tRNA formyltransferase